MWDKIVREIEERGWSYKLNFLTSKEVHQINGYFLKARSDFLPAKVGPKERKIRCEEIRGDYTLWLDPCDPPEELQRLTLSLHELKSSLNHSLYLGLKEFEYHLAYYPQGAFYNKHSDQFEANSSRKISFITYLNEGWKKEDGGELVLYDKMGNIVQELEPMPGTFVCFLSSDFPHEVKKSDKERRSLTGWMHTTIIS